MRTRFLLTFSLMICHAPLAFALDPACEPILKAGEARIKQTAWHSITELSGGMKMEVIKKNGQFFRKASGNWAKFPVNVDDVEKTLISQMRGGEIKLTQCQVVGSGTEQGVPVTIVASRTEMKGAPAADARLYIGKSDGLPYRQTGVNLNVTYRYHDVAAPRL